jgi:hypothetical protein
MSDRITPYEPGASIEDDVDEIVATGVNVHYEAMDRKTAFLIVGGDAFYITARGGKLVCHWSEYREGYGAKPIPHEERE